MRRQHFAKKIDVLAINGGDGTINQTINAFIRAYGDEKIPAIALLRGGTVNVLAKNLGLEGTPDQRLTTLIKLYATHRLSKPLAINTLKVNNRYGFLFANGACASFLEEFYKHKSNQLGALYLFLDICFSGLVGRKKHREILQRLPFSLRTNNSSTALNLEANTILCSTIDDMPLGIKLFPKTRNLKNRFRCLCLLQNERQLLLHAPMLAINPQRVIRHNLQFSCSHLNLQSLEPTILPSNKYTIDGELYEANENGINIENGPQVHIYQY